MEVLILVAETDGPAMMARIGVMRASNPSRRADVQSRSQRPPLGQAQAEERPTAVLIYVDIYKQVGTPRHIKVFANQDAAEKWFEETDPDGVAFEYEVPERSWQPLTLPIL